MSYEELRAAVLALPSTEKRKLARDLVRSADEDEVPPPAQWQIEELERRLKHLEEHPETARTWEQVVEYVRGRRGR